MRTWALELEIGRAEEERRRGRRRGNPYPFIKAANIKRLPTHLKTRLFSKGRAERRGWITHARIDENTAIRGHDLCFDKTCQGNRLV